MSFLSDFVKYIAANSSFILDTDLFVGVDVVDAPLKCVIVQESGGGTENESGMMSQPIQVIVKAQSYPEARELSYTVYDLLNNKPGFSSLSDVFYCEVFSLPALIDRGELGVYIFSTNFLLKRISSS